jgi:hypothetical protein
MNILTYADLALSSIDTGTHTELSAERAVKVGEIAEAAPESDI